MPGLKKESLRVVLLSDMHLGPVLRMRFCHDVLAAVEALQPFDALVIVGDLVDAHVSHIGDVIPECLARFPRPAFYVTGNHELYTGSLEAWLRALHDDAGFTVLENGCSSVAGALHVVGLNEFSAGRHSPAAAPDEAKAFAACQGDVTMPFLVLAHQPNHVPRIEQALSAYPDRAALVVSGHTHGGQVSAPSACMALTLMVLTQFWPITFIAPYFNEYFAGYYRRSATLQVFVRCGHSSLLPVSYF